MDHLQGLSEAEAAARLAAEGPNEIPSSRKRSLLAIAWDVVREPMFLLLVACGLLYLTLGDLEEALMLLGFVFVVMGITLYQERKTERALEALRDLTSPRADVVREGVERRIAGREVVRGDILLVAEGDRVPADARILSCVNLSVDESLLTGESAPVRKVPSGASDVPARPGGDDQPVVYSSTMVVRGRGVAEVFATGPRTEIGKIGRALLRIEPEETLLQKNTRRLVRRLALLGLSLCALVVILYGVARQDWLHGFLAGITLAMATLPEELPVVLTIFLALGAWRISRKQVLTRRVPAIETLGSATVLCTDKTGTLTLNRMSVARLFAGGEVLDVAAEGGDPLPERFRDLVKIAVLASQENPFDPMEKAIRQIGERRLPATGDERAGWSLVREYPLSKDLLALSHAWRPGAGPECLVAAKGAPEAIASLCRLDAGGRAGIEKRVSAMAEDGLRVLGVARAGFSGTSLPDDQREFDFEFLGLVGLADPVRPMVPAAIREGAGAGIRVVIITGDYPGTARSIARQIGLRSADTVLTGPELDAMSDADLRQRIRDVNVFARVVPEQKLRLVNAFKAAREIVAMTGDGVNDAPALKSAHIGIAMGGRGTDVARESSALVLLDDDFSSIVRAARMGRRIFDNIKKAVAYIFAIHVPIAGLSLLPVLFRWPLVMFPVHIVFLELIIDPACSTVFEAEAEEAGVMERPPRDPREPLFSGRLLGLSLLQGTVVLLITLAVFGIVLHLGRGEEEARAMTFTTLVFANLGLILTNRSWTRTIVGAMGSRNPALWWVMGGAAIFLGLVLYLPVLHRAFRFATLHPDDLAFCLGAGLLSILWFEGLKLLNSREGDRRRS